MQASVLSTPPSLSTEPSGEQPAQDLSLTSAPEGKPRFISFASAAIFMIAGLYIIATVKVVGILWLIEQRLSQDNLVFYFFKEFPLWGILPIIFSVAAVITSYSALKLRNGSRYSFLLAATSLVLIPIIVTLLSQWVMEPFVNSSRKPSKCRFATSDS